MKETISYARNQIRELRNVNEASCWVIIGRSRHLNEMEKKSRFHKNSELMKISSICLANYQQL